MTARPLPTALRERVGELILEGVIDAYSVLRLLHEEGLVLWPDEFEVGRIKLNDGSFWRPIASTNPEGWSMLVHRRVKDEG